MTYIITPILGMQLADPLTIQAFETTVVNSNFLALENGIGADRTRLTALEAKGAIRSGIQGIAEWLVADLAALATLSAVAGDVARVTALGNCEFRCTGTTNWVQVGVATFATAASRDTEYAKAAAAYLVNGAQVRRTDTGWTEQYFSLYNSGTNTPGAVSAAWYPTLGRLPFTRLAMSGSIASGGMATIGAAAPLWVPAAFSAGVAPAGDIPGWHNTGANPERVLPTIPGRYRIGLSLEWASNATGNRNAQIQKNGTRVSGSVQELPTQANAWGGTNLVRDIWLNGSTDYISIGANQSSGSTLAILAEFSVEYIGVE